ncbi:MAG: TetR/AcrR family transcriptional regulator [Pseudomonadota bacterium]
MSKSTKHKLISAGAKLFVRTGYEKTTVGDLESAVGLTPRAGGFYRHFASKEALLLAIAEQRFETPEALGLTSVLPLADTCSELLYIARAYDRMNQPDDGLAHLFRTEAARIPELGSMIATANETLLQALSEWIAQKPALKGKNKAEIANATMLIFGAWLFFLTRRNETMSLKSQKSDAFLKRWAEYWARVLDMKNGLQT